MTLFLVDEDAVDELNGKPVARQAEAVQPEEDALDAIKEDFEEKAHEFIKDKIQQLGWEDLQELVAGVLRGMGYKTLVSQRGPDRGKDIVASPDGLGLEDPKIKVEVKHRDQGMGAPEIRSFIGGLRPGEKACTSLPVASHARRSMKRNAPTSRLRLSTWICLCRWSSRTMTSLMQTPGRCCR